MNSFRAVYRALSYEVERQKRLLEEGKPIFQETRHWDEVNGVTVSARSKEEDRDYRYFPDPDLLPFSIKEKMVEEIKSELPELPLQREERFMSEYELSQGEAEILVQDKEIADFLKIRKKKFFLLPYTVFEEKGRALAEIYSGLVEKSKSGNFIFYLGDLIGPRLVLTLRSAPSFILRGFILEELSVTVPLSAGEKVRPTPLILACRRLVSLLLTETDIFPRNLIAGREVSLKKWISLVNQVFKGKTKVSFEANRSKLLGVYDHQFLIEEPIDQKMLRETKDWFERNKDGFYTEFETKPSLNKIEKETRPLKDFGFLKKPKISTNRFFHRFHLPRIRFSFRLSQPKLSEKIGFSFPAFSFTKTSSFLAKFPFFSRPSKFLVF